jgi:hypothetical protein
VEGRIRTFHNMRHTALTNFAPTGASPIAVMSTAEHRPMQTTKGYLHLAGVVIVGAGIVGHGTHSAGGVAVMVLSGLCLYGLDLWHHPGLWNEVAGVFVAAKLLVVFAMLLASDLAGVLFWLVLVASAVVSHAPRVVRHRRILG